MTILYHSSSFLTKELKPSFHHTGVEVHWDETESNRFLYATTDKLAALEQGFASLLDRKFRIHRFQSRPGKIEVELDRKFPLTREDVSKAVVYLYRIRFDEKDGWIKNDNRHNGLTTEWKTDRAIANNIDKVIEVRIGEYLEPLITVLTPRLLRIENIHLNKLSLESIDRPSYLEWIDSLKKETE